jgi:hypothetical protein
LANLSVCALTLVSTDDKAKVRRVLARALTRYHSPTDVPSQYTPIIDAILRASDLSTISVKKVRNGLSEQTGVDFLPLKVCGACLLSPATTTSSPANKQTNRKASTP